MPAMAAAEFMSSLTISSSVISLDSMLVPRSEMLAVSVRSVDAIWEPSM